MTAANSANIPTCEACGASLHDPANGGLCSRCLLLGVLKCGADVEEATEPALPNPATLLLRRQFAGYELIAEIARGGMGAVFKAQQKEPDRTVALKVISIGELATPAMVERFRTEAGAAARLEHPNIVPIYEVGEADGWQFYSMRLVRGRTLADLIQPHGLPYQTAAGLMTKAARAVHHAHERGVLHRDLKPTNILIDEDGEPYLTDFGLAKLSESDSNVTYTHAVFGTPAYMSPEQAAGRTRDVTVAADIYSLGAILFEMLAGRPPIVGDGPVDILRQIGDGAIPRLSTLRQGVPRDLEIISMKCLSNDPDRRYESAEDLADDLDRWQRNEPIEARPVSGWERVGMWIRRHPVEAGLAIALVVSAIGLTSLSVVLNFRLNAALGDARRSAGEATRQLLVQHLGTAAVRTSGHDGFAGAVSLGEALKLADPRSPEEAAVRQRLTVSMQFSPSLLRLWDAGAPPVRLEFSPDNRWLIAHRRNARPRVWNLRTATEQVPPGNDRRTPLGSFANRIGNRIVEFYATAPRALLWDRAEGTRRALPVPDGEIRHGAFSPDGTMIAIAGDGVLLIDADSLQLVESVSDERGPCLWLGFSRDGESLLTIRERNTGWFRDLRTGRWSPASIKADPLQAPPRFGADGKTLLTAVDRGYRLYRLPSGEVEEEGTVRGTIFDLALAPRGDRFGVASFAGQAQIFRTGESRRENESELRIAHGSGANRVRFVPHGPWIATAGFDYTIRIQSLTTGRALFPILRHNGLIEALAFSQDGRFLATAGADHVVRVFDLGRSGVRHRAGFSGGRISNFSPDGVLVTGVDYQDRLVVWNAETDQPVGDPFPVDPSCGHHAFDPTGNWLGAAAYRGRVVIFDWRKRRVQQRFVPEGGATTFVFSPGGRQVAVAGLKGSAMIHDIETGAIIGKELFHGELIRRMDWTANGRWIMTRGDSTVLLWDTETCLRVGTAIEAPPGFQVGAVRLRPDGNRLVVAFKDPYIESSFARVYRLPDLAPVSPPLDHGDGVLDAVFSPDGGRVATCGEDNSVRIWDAESGVLLTPVMKHDHVVAALDFSPEGWLLASGSLDGTLKLWDAERGELTAPALPLTSGIRVIRFAPDGRRLLVVASDGDQWLVQLQKADLAAKDLAALAGLCIGRHPEPSGILRELSAVEQAEAFERLRSRYGMVFAWPE